jgi:hypothetical protein
MWNWALTPCLSGPPLSVISIEDGQRDITASISHGSPCVRARAGRLELDGRSGRARARRRALRRAGDTVQRGLDLSRTASATRSACASSTHLDGSVHAAAWRTPTSRSRSTPVRWTSPDCRRGADQPVHRPDDELDLARWAHDALALALPIQLLCRPDCKGLCPVCGASLNDADPPSTSTELSPTRAGPSFAN